MRRATLAVLVMALVALPGGCSHSSALQRQRGREALTYDHRPDYWEQMSRLKLPEGEPLDAQLLLIAHGFDAHVRLGLASQLGRQMERDPGLAARVAAMLDAPSPGLAWAAAWTMEKCSGRWEDMKDRVISVYRRPDVIAFERLYHE